MKYEVVIPAAGQGKRMKANKNKLWIELESEPLIAHTLRVFGNDPNCKKIILAINPAERNEFTSLKNTLALRTEVELIDGGSERQYSVKNGVDVLEDDEGIVLVHDGARPFITQETIQQLIMDAERKGASVLAVRVKDTIKQVENQHVKRTIDRNSLWAIQTPQAFRVSILKKAHQAAEKEGFLGTDESSLVERIGVRVAITEGDYDNIKITTPEDLYFAKAIIEKKRNR